MWVVRQTVDRNALSIRSALVTWHVKTRGASILAPALAELMPNVWSSITDPCALAESDTPEIRSPDATSYQVRH